MHTAPPPQTIGQRLARRVLALAGWRLKAELPAAERYVLIGAPHTTNWDLALTLLVKASLGLPMRWMAKAEAFRGPAGPVLRALGGIPVNRKAPGRLAAQVADHLRGPEPVVIAITPEGTRAAAPHWKTGFYRIAQAAGVPVGFAFVDYPNKTVGIAPGFVPSGDLEADFALIRRFYADKHGKHPAGEGPIRPRGA